MLKRMLKLCIAALAVASLALLAACSSGGGGGAAASSSNNNNTNTAATGVATPSKVAVVNAK